MVSTSALLLGVPWALAFSEEQQVQEMEREMRMQQSANEVSATFMGGRVQGEDGCADGDTAFDPGIGWTATAGSGRREACLVGGGECMNGKRDRFETSRVVAIEGCVIVLYSLLTEEHHFLLHHTKGDSLTTDGSRGCAFTPVLRDYSLPAASAHHFHTRVR